MIPMSTSSRLQFVLLATMACIVFGACGSTDDSNSMLDDRVPIKWEAGDIDPYGCPFIEPTSWEGAEAHRELCGSGCEPWGLDDMLIACIGDNVPRYPEELTVSPAAVCVSHPVSGQDFLAGDSRTARPLFNTCWRLCNLEVLLADAPAGCFEDGVGSP